MKRILAIALLAAACHPAKTRPEITRKESKTLAKPPKADPAHAAYAAAVKTVQQLTADADANPLLADWTGALGGTPAWDKAKVDQFPAAFTAGLALRNAEIQVIDQNPEPPTFANTIVPYEAAGRHQDRAETMFGVLTSTQNTPDVQAIDREWSPKLAAANDQITFDAALFGRIAKVYETRTTSDLTAERQRLVEKTYDRLVSRGAQLAEDQKAELGKINEELATLFTDFSNKVLADEDTFIEIKKKGDLAGLPASEIASYKAAATEKKVEGWAVVNTRSSVDPFLTFSANRKLREQVWKAFKNRGDTGGANDTNATIARILALRTARAKLLGFPSHANWRMHETMAKDPATAMALMMRVWPAAVARVKEEVADMTKISKTAIEPWDYLYYAEKVRKQKYAIDQEQLKPYFELNNMIAASFYMAERLYGLAFEEVTGQVTTWNADVRVWKVTDKASGAFVGLFYGDYFARAGKRSGAWTSGLRGHETFLGGTQTPITTNNNNFVKGGPGQPVLISLDDAQTLFHEFGHALHGLLSQVNYPGLSSTPRDFVEFPSQVHEMWVMTRPILDKFCLHYQTKQPMPQALLDKVEAAKKFNQGYITVEYLSAAIVDMQLHTTTDPVDPDAFEREALEKLGMPAQVAMRHRLPQFNHLFSSDAYSAGYYSYLWSEVMDADARKAFQEAGDVFDPTTAAKLRKFILEPGNSTDRAEAYRQFRGRDPDVRALQEKRGFPVQ